VVHRHEQASARAEALLALALADKRLEDLLGEAVQLAGVLLPGTDVAYHALAADTDLPADPEGTDVPVRADDGRPLGLLRLSRPPADADLLFVRRLAEVLGICITRSRRDEELVRSERRLVEAQRISQVGSYDFEIATNTNTWSDQLYRIYGREPQSFMASYDVFLSLLHPDDREHVMAVHQRALETLEPFEMEERIVWPDGQVRTLASWGEVVPDEQGHPARMVGICWDITERRAIEDQLVREALHDRLTGLPNRALFVDRLSQSLAALPRRQGALAVLFLDVDQFKVINDSLGHEAGDDVLVELGQRLEALMRPGDTVARFGGDEFVVLCLDVDHPAAAVHIAERLQEGISAPITTHGSDVVVTISAGIALSTSPEDRAGDLLRDADSAMYRAKRDGRARSVLFADAMREEARARLDTEVELRRALADGDLRLHYQPVVDLSSGTVVGVEALLRWQHRTRGLVLPGEVIPIAEESGLIVPIGEWALEQACRQLVAWHAQVPRDVPLTMAVNLSGVQMARPDFVQRVAEVLERTGVDRSALSLEITETVLMRDAEQALGVLRALKDLGVSISVDDFGTGYSSLSYLKRFPVDVLKIDRSFVDGLGSDPDDLAIVQAIVALAGSLGMATLAEGIETPAHLEVLRQLGCGLGQGYLLGRPCAEDQLVPLLRTGAAPVIPAARGPVEDLAERSP
jgi:diguanylate cyclase (GGDEF)-like protein/PAS domain S-box-containing protein